MQCVIWTNPGGGLCNMDRCYKWQYLYEVLGKCFIGYCGGQKMAPHVNKWSPLDGAHE